MARLLCVMPLLAAAVHAASNMTLSEMDSRITYEPSVQWHGLGNFNGSDYSDGSIMRSYDPRTSVTIEFEGPHAPPLARAS
jgi:hypothetical protein